MFSPVVLVESPSNCEVVLNFLSIQLVCIHILSMGLHARFGLQACLGTLYLIFTRTHNNNPTSIAFVKSYQFIYLRKLRVISTTSLLDQQTQNESREKEKEAADMTGSPSGAGSGKTIRFCKLPPASCKNSTRAPLFILSYPTSGREGGRGMASTGLSSAVRLSPPSPALSLLGLSSTSGVTGPL